MLRVWIGGWRHVEHLDPAKSHTVYQVEVTMIMMTPCIVTTMMM